MTRQLFISVFFTICAFPELRAQPLVTKSDRETAGLKGKVKLIVSSSYRYDIEKSKMLWEHTDTAYYNKAGNLILEITYASDVTKNLRTLYAYDKSGRHVYRKASYDINSRLRNEIITSYDSLGNSVECRKTNWNDTLTDTERYFYDNKHRCTRISYAYASKLSAKGYAAELTEEVKYAYTEKGLIVKQENFDHHGYLKSATTFEYDGEGNMTAIRINPDNITIRRKLLNGKAIESKVLTGNNKLLGTSLYCYDLSGRQTSYKRYDAEGILADDLEHDYESSDKRGNWLKMQVCYMQKPTVYEERKIIYYK